MSNNSSSVMSAIDNNIIHNVFFHGIINDEEMHHANAYSIAVHQYY